MEQLETHQIKKTVLYDRHCDLGAKMVEFNGWKMPLYYQGIIPEHHIVRKQVGLFDLSHMGKINVEGKDAERFLDYLSTNIIEGKPNFSAIYTVFSSSSGGCVDDVIVYKQDTTHFFVIVNAGNRQKDLEHLQRESKSFDVIIKPCFSEEGILAIQGPKADLLMNQLFPGTDKLQHMHFQVAEFEGIPVTLSKTGYTGENGFELYAPNATIVKLWDRFLSEGQNYCIAPIGLGARDTLRLEMGYALYGHEISEEIGPNESVSFWTVKWKKPKFLGKEALERLEPNKRIQYGVILTEPGIARTGYDVFQNGQKIGNVTSGTYSPTLNKAIAIVLVSKKLNIGEDVEIKIRENKCNGVITALPFKNKEN